MLNQFLPNELAFFHLPNDLKYLRNFLKIKKKIRETIEKSLHCVLMLNKKIESFINSYYLLKVSLKFQTQAKLP